MIPGAPPPSGCRKSLRVPRNRCLGVTMDMMAYLMVVRAACATCLECMALPRHGPSRSGQHAVLGIQVGKEMKDLAKKGKIWTFCALFASKKRLAWHGRGCVDDGMRAGTGGPRPWTSRGGGPPRAGRALFPMGAFPPPRAWPPGIDRQGNQSSTKGYLWETMSA